MISSSQKSRVCHARDASNAGGSQSAWVAVLCVVLFLSGTGALIFETLWLRLSGLAFGNSIWAAALILSSFMTGLAFGNALAASSTIRQWRPLHLYALLELLVAFFGCTIVFGLPILGELMRPVWQTLWNYQPTLLGLRFVVSFLILLVPTTAMGLTLPVIIEDPLLRETEFGRAIGFLYGSNTLGAMAGAVIGETWLIRAFGLYGTSLAAASVLCIAAAAALSVARFGARRHIPAFKSADTSAHSKFPLSFGVDYRPPWRLLFVSFGTGLIFLTLEVIWFRFLRLYVASSPTVFAIMLAVVLGGIGVGGIVAGAIRRRLDRLNQLLPMLLLLAGVLTLLSYLLFPSDLIPAHRAIFNLTWWQIVLLSLALVLPVALLSGILFPSIAAGVQATLGDRMNSTGITTLFNTTGAAFGPLLASFLLLPSIGYQSSLILCAAAYALLGIFVSRRSSWSFRQPMSSMIMGLCAAMILLIGIFPYSRDATHFGHARHSLGRLVKKIEGPSDTYQLLRYDLFGEPYHYQLLTSAFSMSGTSPQSQRYMRMFAYLPFAFRPQSEDVLLICYGCGVTADAFLHGLQVKRMDVVDISKEVFALAEFYSGINYSNPLRDPRVTAIVQDGRFFLQASPRQYDIISGEPPPPKVAGSVNLYTEEFFSLIRRRLKEGGIATFWLPIDQLKMDEAKAILRAFYNAFPNASVWANADEQWIMMGRKGRAVPIKEEEVGRLWHDPAIKADLNRIGIEVPQQLAAMFVMDGEEINRLTHDVAPLTDIYPKRLTDEPWDEQAGHRFALTHMEASSALGRFRGSPLFSGSWQKTSDESLELCFNFRESRYRCAVVERCNTLAELDIYLRHCPLRAPVLNVLGSDEFRLAIAERVARKTESPSAQIMPDLLAGALARRDLGEAIRLLESEEDRGISSVNDAFLLTYLYCLNGDVEKAERFAARDLGSVKRNWFVDWLWEKLQTDFGFHPPS
jgi:spermidine synthase